jgi:hypothetical protein
MTVIRKPKHAINLYIFFLIVGLDTPLEFILLFAT